ncbi:putative ribonuclease H-like domain-containing protein [Tanacetum coccineum]
MNLTEFEGIDVIDHLEEVGSSSKEVVKIGKANRNKGYNINKLTPPPSLRLEEIPPTSIILPQPIYHALTPNQKEKIKEVLDIKYKELEESKPILEVLESYVIYKKKLDEILIGKERLKKKEFSQEDKVGIIEHGLPKKMCDPGNYILPMKINGVVEMVALVYTGASVSVLPYSIYKDLGLVDPKPYQTNLTMADNTQAKGLGEVKNVRIQIGYQAYVVDLLILDIPSYVEAFEMEGEDDWLGSFEVGRDKDGNVKYGPVVPLFIDIEDDMERALAMEAYFNPFKNVIMFKKLVNFLGSLLVQLKNLDWGNEGYGTYKKVDGDGDWHARFEFVTPSGRKFNRAFKTKTTTRKLSGKFKTDNVLRSIADNILLTQELMHNYHLDRGLPRCAFKVDIQKLYDIVDWDFLKKILAGFRFHTHMIGWIMECVTTTSFSISINGSLHGFFKGKRGLRQGDPLSIFFTLIMEVLTLMLQRGVRNAYSFTYHRYCSKLELINLCFADDLFIFAHGDVDSAKIIKDALFEFKEVSGLVPSLPKSTTYFCNVLNHTKLAIL